MGSISNISGYEQNNDTNSSCKDIFAYYTAQNDWSTYLAFRILAALIYALIIFVAVSGNCLVITAVVRDPHLRSVRNLFIVSLSCSDILVCITSGVFSPISAIVKVWLFGQYLCYLLPLVQGMSICISTFTLTSIAIDRYILIIHPAVRAINVNIALVMIAAIWCLAFGVSFPASFHQNLLPENWGFCGPFCAENWSQNPKLRDIYMIMVPICQFLIPLSVILFCYARILVRLEQGIILKAARSVRKTDLNERQKLALRRQKRTNRMLISMVIIFVVCWAPMVFFNLVMLDLGFMPDILARQHSFIAILVHCIALTTTCWNPILYAALNEQFRDAFVSLIPESICRKKPRNLGHERVPSFLENQRNARSIPMSTTFSKEQKGLDSGDNHYLSPASTRSHDTVSTTRNFLSQNIENAALIQDKTDH